MAAAERVAFIPNALDCKDGALREKIIKRGIGDLEDIGLQSDIVDLRHYFAAPSALQSKMMKCKVMFVTGGNTFVLRRAMRQSCLDSFLFARKNDDGFLYAGYSAGACVCAPTLKGIDLLDDPEAVPVGYERETIWDGLSLIDYSIVPHYRSDSDGSSATRTAVAYFVENNIPFRVLRDDEVIIQ